jgi:1-deoxy-D-xylulose-5-phosphate reductoisomerase
MTAIKRISLIGATGSIGTSVLRVVDAFPDRLKVVALASGHDAEALAKLARRYEPEVVAIADSHALDRLRADLSATASTQVLGGDDGLRTVAAWDSADVTVVAAVGFAGVHPTMAAINAGKSIALANKETLVAAGAVVMPLARARGITLAPIDSEHAGLWQCLRAGRIEEVRRLILTASGGPFRTRPLSEFAAITPAEALTHPTWRMGPRITIDSATMMNKGFEIIEAAWLFGIDPSAVEVVIHPQSIVHALVEFRDGSVIAQLAAPDMRLPILYALFAPERPPGPADWPRFAPTLRHTLEFIPPEPERYPALALARRAYAMGPTAPAVLNAADEVAVAAFLQGRLTFPGIVHTVAAVLAEHRVVFNPGISDIETADRWARRRAGEIIAAGTS